MADAHDEREKIVIPEDVQDWIDQTRALAARLPPTGIREALRTAADQVEEEAASVAPPAESTPPES